MLKKQEIDNINKWSHTIINAAEKVSFEEENAKEYGAYRLDRITEVVNKFLDRVYKRKRQSDSSYQI